MWKYLAIENPFSLRCPRFATGILQSFLLLISFTLGQDVSLSFQNYAEDAGSVDVYMVNTSDVYGFQFNVTSLDVTSAGSRTLQWISIRRRSFNYLGWHTSFIRHLFHQACFRRIPTGTESGASEIKLPR